MNYKGIEPKYLCKKDSLEVLRDGYRITGLSGRKYVLRKTASHKWAVWITSNETPMYTDRKTMAAGLVKIKEHEKGHGGRLPMNSEGRLIASLREDVKKLKDDKNRARDIIAKKDEKLDHYGREIAAFSKALRRAEESLMETQALLAKRDLEIKRLKGKSTLAIMTLQLE